PVLARALGRPAAVFFHGVERKPLDPRIQTDHHDIESFRQIARALKENFEVLPLSALAAVLENPQRHPRAVFLMADDGYANTLTNAAPILDELELPWTLFVSTHHIDTGEPNPMFLARLFVFFAPEGAWRIPHIQDEIVLGDGAQRSEMAPSLLNQMKGLAASQAREALGAMMAAFSGNELAELIEKFPSEKFLTWERVRQLRAKGVEIGAHAHWHWPMNASQSIDYLREQAETSRARIEAEIGRPRAFAYPFGNTDDISADAWRAVRDAGFEYGFTTLSAALSGGENPFLLPRYGLAPRETGLASLIPLLSAGNPRLARWQERLAG
ncbi:MAG TPA: polysaccharide deacetylase family protein, partial [Rhizomicrobium sp.]|nr:polysaccharide deacetylase family protein [Rhizomicrobium sp.]